MILNIFIFCAKICSFFLQVNQLVSKVRNQTEAIERQLRIQAEVQLTQLADVFDNPVSNMTAYKRASTLLKMAKENNTVAANAAADIRRPLQGIDLTPTIVIGEKIEGVRLDLVKSRIVFWGILFFWFRWPVTMAVLSVLLVLCVILLVGVARHNRCALIAFSVCGLIAVIASYLMASVYLASGVALGDLCVAPEKYVEDQVTADASKEILRYYTSCERARANPFTQRLREAKTTVENMRTCLNMLRKPAGELFPKANLDTKFTSLLNEVHATVRNFFVLLRFFKCGVRLVFCFEYSVSVFQVNSADTLITSLTALVDCRALHIHYLRGTRALCNVGLTGLTLMLLSAILAGLLLTTLVWVDSHTWIYIRKRLALFAFSKQKRFTVFVLCQQEGLPSSERNGFILTSASG